MLDGGRLAGIVSIGDVVKIRMEELQAEHQQLRAYITQGGKPRRASAPTVFGPQSGGDHLEGGAVHDRALPADALPGHGRSTRSSRTQLGRAVPSS